MERSKFETLGVETSVLGFGCMRLPKCGEEIDRQAAFDMVDYAYRHGVTYFDTAWPYHNGTSEPFVGEALSRYPRDSYYVATKLPVWLLKTPEDFERIFSQQLEHLKTDHIDFYLLHAMNKERIALTEKLGIYDLVRQKQAEGKIRFVGFSFHDSPEVFEQYLDLHPWDFAQIQYNYIDPHLLRADELYSALEKRNIPCVVMEPVRGGFLATLPDDITSIFKEHAPDRSPASWALRWVAEHPNVKVVLSGMSNMEQMQDNVETFSRPYALSEEEHKVVDKVVRAITSVKTVPCTGCAYCMPCPFGVNIPKIFSIYNNCKLFRNETRSGNEYRGLSEKELATSCRSCRKCMQVCPQHLTIPQLLRDAHEVLSKL